MKILLVDHTSIYRDILTQALAGYKEFSLVFAGSAEEARTVAAGQEFHFIAISLHLPDADGLAFAKELRASGRFLFEPIVLLTSSANAELALLAEQAGVTEIFRKQDIAEMVSFLSRFLGVFTPLRGRILYVEDARDQRLVLEAQLRAWGMEVDAFPSAEEAWASFVIRDYDLVICDVVLSGRMTGSRLVNRIRRQPGAKGDVLILAVTAFDTAARRIQLFHLGVDDYVSKPVVPIELHARIQGMMSRKLIAERNRALIDASSLAVVLINDDSMIQAMNKEGEAMFGYSTGDLLGEPITRLIAGPASVMAGGFVQAHLAALDSRGLPWEQSGVRSNGEYFPLRFSVVETATMGVQRQFAVLIRDISAERELAQYLVRAKEEAEASTRLKSEFLANMSHEIRTPMTGIIGMTQLALDGPLPEVEREYVQKAHDSAIFLLGVLNDILDLSKIEAGKLAFDSVPFDLAKTLGRVVDMLQVRALEKGLQLECERDESVPRGLAGDPLRLAQVLTNLVGNGIKFTKKGRVAVRVTVAARDAAANRIALRFDVMDTGIGLSPDKIKRLFQPFSQAEASTAREYGGSGLGLAISRRLVEMMGGSIDVDSEPGVGSNFHFVAWFGLSDEALRQKPEMESARDHRRLKGLHVLLAEDNPVNQQLASLLLARIGIAVTIAGNGAEAIAALHEEPKRYDAILMDLQMPEVDGLAATRAIRSETRFDALPIIALTANAMAEDRQRCLEAGMQDYVAKPLDVEQLYSTLERWCGREADLEAPSPPDAAATAATMDSVFDEKSLALDRLGGDEAMFNYVMHHFLESHAGSADEIRTALAAGEVADARRLAHTLKGLAATVGAGHLTRAALALEEALRKGEGREKWPALIDALDERLTELRTAWSS